MHLRTMSTNQVHPRAAVSVLRHTMEESFMGSVIQICDDVVALFFWIHGIPRLLIWQWTEGTLLVVSVPSSPQVAPHNELFYRNNSTPMRTGPSMTSPSSPTAPL